MENKIPKIIHYCWFGKKPLPKLAQKCIKSWQKYCPDYQIIRWDETNFDINSNLYIKQAYEAKKYAFVSDYVRLWALYNYGGIYMDTDVELIKNLDSFLNKKAFIGFQSSYKLNLDLITLNSGLIGAQKGNKFIEDILDLYNSLSFVNNDNFDLTPNTVRITEYAIRKYNLIPKDIFQDLGDIVIYPSEYFSPGNYYFLKLTNNTYAIHYFTASWFSWRQKLKRKISFVGIKLLGFKGYNIIKDKVRSILKL
jgi:hypothetical protein